MSKLPEGWIETSIGQLTQVVGGGTPSTSVQSHFEGNIPWITPADLSGYDDVYIAKGRRNLSKEGLSDSSAKLLPKDSVLYSTRAPIGYVAIAANPLATNQGFKSMLPSERYDSKFAYYYLKSIKAYAESEAVGTTFKELSGKKFGELKFPLAPLPEQKRIVAKLDNLFAHLDQLKARLQNIPTLLKQFRQAVLTQAVTGKLTEEWREGKKLKSYLDEITVNRKKLYEAKLRESKGSGAKPKKLDETEFETFEYSGAYDIPSYWELANLKNVCDLITDGEHATPERTPEGYLLLSARNIQNGYLSFKTVDYVPESEFIRIKRRCNPEYNDVLISCSGTIGRVCRVPKNMEFVLVRSVALLKLQSNAELSNYLELVLRSEFVQNQILTLQKATAQANLFIGPIGKIVIPIPSYEEQREIVRRVESLFAVADRIEGSYSTLQEKIDYLPQAILSKAFTGQLVDQDSDDESATVLLERIKQSKLDSISLEGRNVIEKYFEEVTFDVMEIYEVIEDAKRSLTAKEVWQKSKFKDDIDGFYAELKEEVEVKKRIKESDDGKYLVLAK